MRLISLLCAAVLAAAPAHAQERYTYSIIRGSDWAGQAPTEFGALLEYRLRSEVIAPQRLNGSMSNDRAYVGAFTAGVHTHMTRGDANVSLGLDLVAVGPQTQLSSLQDSFHNVISAPNVSNRVAANQIGNAVYPTALGEASFDVAVGETTTLRPFAELQYGVEDIARIGFDVLIGAAIQNDLWLRDSPTGQLYSGVQSGGAGSGFVLGADFAFVGDSAYFPASFGTQAKDTRTRVRAGVHARLGDEISYFYGLTYLSEEYIGQPEGQMVGSLKLNFNW